MNWGGRDTARDETPREERGQIHPRWTVAIGRLSTVETSGPIEVGLMPSHDAT
jgi:hypothetical protein